MATSIENRPHKPLSMSSKRLFTSSQHSVAFQPQNQNTKGVSLPTSSSVPIGIDKLNASNSAKPTSPIPGQKARGKHSHKEFVQLASRDESKMGITARGKHPHKEFVQIASRDESKMGISLKDLVEKYSQSFPLSVRIVKGDGKSIVAEDVYDIHYVKRTKVVTIVDISRNAYTIPFNSAAKFAIIYSPSSARSETTLFKTGDDIIKATERPKIVTATRHVKNPDGSVISENEVLIIKVKTSQDLTAFSIQDNCLKTIPKEAVGYFTTDPTKCQLHLSDLIKCIPDLFPTKARIFLDHNPHPNILGNDPITLRESSIISTLVASRSAADGKAAKTSMTAIEFPVTLRNVRVSVIQTSIDTNHAEKNSKDDATRKWSNPGRENKTAPKPNSIQVTSPSGYEVVEASIEQLERYLLEQASTVQAMSENEEDLSLKEEMYQPLIFSESEDERESIYEPLLRNGMEENDQYVVMIPDPKKFERMLTPPQVPSRRKSIPLSRCHSLRSYTSESGITDAKPPLPGIRPNRQHSASGSPKHKSYTPSVTPRRVTYDHLPVTPSQSLTNSRAISPVSTISTASTPPPILNQELLTPHVITPRGYKSPVVPSRAAPGIQVPAHTYEILQRLDEIETRLNLCDIPSSITGDDDSDSTDYRVCINLGNSAVRKELQLLQSRCEYLETVVHELHEEVGHLRAAVDNSKEKELYTEKNVTSSIEYAVSLDCHTNIAYLKSLNNSQVVLLLQAMNLEQYIELFMEEQIDGGILSECTEDVLKTELEITNGLHRLKIMRVITGKASAASMLSADNLSLGKLN